MAVVCEPLIGLSPGCKSALNVAKRGLIGGFNELVNLCRKTAFPVAVRNKDLVAELNDRTVACGNLHLQPFHRCEFHNVFLRFFYVFPFGVTHITSENT